MIVNVIILHFMYIVGEKTNMKKKYYGKVLDTL